MSGDIEESKIDELDDDLDDEVASVDDEDDDVLIDSDDDDDDIDELSETVVIVDKLEAKLDESEAARRREIRRKLEERREMMESDLDSTFNFNLDDD